MVSVIFFVFYNFKSIYVLKLASACKQNSSAYL